MTLEQLLPEAKKLISDKVINVFKEQGAKVAFAKLYTFLPVAIRLFVKEEAFINFCMQHQDKLFGKQHPVKKTTTKKAAPKKVAVEKVVKKEVVKKIVAKKAASKKK